MSIWFHILGRNDRWDFRKVHQGWPLRAPSKKGIVKLKPVPCGEYWLAGGEYEQEPYVVQRSVSALVLPPEANVWLGFVSPGDQRVNRLPAGDHGGWEFMLVVVESMIGRVLGRLIKELKLAEAQRLASAKCHLRGLLRTRRTLPTQA